MAQMPFSPCSDASNCTDQSVHMLGRIFGPVIDSLVKGIDPNTVDAGNNILATMFSFFNSGILIIGSLIVSYVAVMGVTNTANDGEAMGRSWSSLWTPVRIVVGGAVLLPTTSGFSFIQLIVLMFSLWGVGFANGTYKAGMAMGILSPDGLVAGVNAPGNFYGLRDFARQYASAAYCARAATYVYSGANVTPVSTGGAPVPDKTMVVDGRREQTFFLKDRNEASNLAGGSAICGTVKLSSYSPQPAEEAIPQALEQLRATVQGKKVEMALLLMADIRTWVGSWPFTVNDPGWENVDSNRLNEIVKAREAQLASQLAAEVTNQQGGVENGLEAFIKTLTDDGWAAAGGWFQRVGMVRSQIAGVLADPVGSVGAPSLGGLPADARASLLTNSVTTVAEAINAKAEERTSSTQSRTTKAEDIASLIPKDPKSDINLSSLRTDMDAKMSSFVNGVMLNVVEIATGAGSNGQTPLCGTAGQMGGSLNRMKCVGDYLTVARAGILVADVAIKTAGTAIRVIAGTLSSVKGLGNGLDLDKIVTPLWDWVLEVPVKQLALMATYMEPLAFYFGVFLPSLPYTLFMIVFVGWVLAVLQSIIAAPLWAVMHMTPDRTFVGSQTQGYLLLLSLFARPALAILGLFAAVLVSDPVIDYIAKGFFAMRGAVVTSSGNVGAISDFLTFAWWFMVFGLTLLPVLYMTFGLPQTLPDTVLTWIGGGLQSMGETSAVGDMRGGMARVGSSVQGSSTGMRLGGGNAQGKLSGPNGGPPDGPQGGGPGGGGGGIGGAGSSGGGRPALLNANNQGVGGDGQDSGSGGGGAAGQDAAQANRTFGEKVSDAAGVGLGRAITGTAGATGRAMRGAGGAALSAGRAGIESFRSPDGGSSAARVRSGLKAGALAAGAGLAGAASRAGADYKQAFSTAGAEGKAAFNEGSDARIKAYKESLAGGSAPAGSEAGGEPVGGDTGRSGTDVAGQGFEQSASPAGSAPAGSEMDGEPAGIDAGRSGMGGAGQGFEQSASPVGSAQAGSGSSVPGSTTSGVGGAGQAFSEASSPAGAAPGSSADTSTGSDERAGGGQNSASRPAARTGDPYATDRSTVGNQDDK